MCRPLGCYNPSTPLYLHCYAALLPLSSAYLRFATERIATAFQTSRPSKDGAQLSVDLSPINRSVGTPRDASPKADGHKAFIHTQDLW